MLVAEALRLNLGCKDTHIPGFKNVDICASPNVDFVRDIHDLGFIDESVDEIYASNCYEHIKLPDAQRVLSDWCRMLKPGGILWLSVPDFDFVVKFYAATGTLSDWLIYHLYGEQKNPYQFHYTVYNWPRLRLALSKAGFSKAEKVDALPYGLDDASTMVDNQIGQKISLNVKAIK